MDMKSITIEKNRGWRGLAEVKIFDSEYTVMHDVVFSFSQAVWEDMQRGYIVIQDVDHYYVVYFNNTEELPKGQRSVLITDFEADVTGAFIYKKTEWQREATPNDYKAIYNFLRNKNNHTTSDWNYIGIRVIPSI